ncbi:DNA polymerase I [Candidatus Methylopumilus planktonicus]|uniref:DNA polymerase I n=1 Tax=Candidatus Methylopumilus planktonicus TaxID=1581557 RepID=UPI001122731D|nr:DNA polymerase I [Candidatus Methylopumilus planktonicus]QDD01230.1 DNA polymerase I [Candidatus Methylopumilus planktonicus]
MKTLLLVDGSSYLYRAFHGLPDLRNSRQEPTGAIYGVLNMLRKLHKEFPSDYSVCVFDAKGKTFRNDLYPEYKANRSAMPDDLRAQIQPLHEAITAMGWPILIQEGVEADDVIGTLCKEATQNQFNVVVSTGDKDLAQLVNKHVTLINTMTNEKLDIEGVKNKFGLMPNQIIDYLTLIGDTSDNVPGVEKVGPKTALKWLNEYQTLDNIVNNAAQFSGVVGENLRKALDWIPKAKDLITIRCDLDIDKNWDNFKPKAQDPFTLENLYQRFEFKNWLNEIKEGSSENNLSGKSSEEKISIKSPSHFISKIKYDTIFDKDLLHVWLEKIKEKKYVCVDTETNSLDTMQAKIVGISIAVNAGEAAYIPLAHDYPGAPKQLSIDTILNLLKPMLEDEKIKKIGQNIKYDAHVFLNHGIHLKGIKHDTMLQSYVAESHQSHGMDNLSLRHLGHTCVSYEDVAGKGVNQLKFNQVDINVASHYSSEDADVTLQLNQFFNPTIESDVSLKFIYENIEMPAAGVLLKIERNGVLVDHKKLNAQSHEIGKKILLLEEEAYQLAGQPFNLASPKQLQDILFNKLGIKSLKKTPSGAPSTDEEVLQDLALDYPLPKLLLEHRSLSKLKSTYTDKLPKMINANTGRIHTSYNQAVAITGRLASSDPNLQNIPIRTLEGRKIREAFIANEGSSILSADYSQIELRIMAYLSQDKRLLEAFKNNEDIHKSTAAEIFGCDLGSVSQEQRRYAKVINFGLIYGMSVFGLSKSLGIERSAASNYIETYFARYPGVKRYMEEAKLFAKDKGYVETFFGRRLWIPEINSSNGIRRAAAERAAINAPMQGTAADLIKLAMISVDQWLSQNTHLKTKMIMQVHDELVFEVPQDEINILRRELPLLMEGVANLDIPLIVDIGVGLNWDTAH